MSFPTVVNGMVNCAALGHAGTALGDVSIALGVGAAALGDVSITLGVGAAALGDDNVGNIMEFLNYYDLRWLQEVSRGYYNFAGGFLAGALKKNSTDAQEFMTILCTHGLPRDILPAGLERIKALVKSLAGVYDVETTHRHEMSISDSDPYPEAPFVAACANGQTEAAQLIAAIEFPAGKLDDSSSFGTYVSQGLIFAGYSGHADTVDWLVGQLPPSKYEGHRAKVSMYATINPFLLRWLVPKAIFGTGDLSALFHEMVPHAGGDVLKITLKEWGLPAEEVLRAGGRLFIELLDQRRFWPLQVIFAHCSGADLAGLIEWPADGRFDWTMTDCHPDDYPALLWTAEQLRGLARAGLGAERVAEPDAEPDADAEPSAEFDAEPGAESVAGPDAEPDAAQSAD